MAKGRKSIRRKSSRRRRSSRRVRRSISGGGLSYSDFDSGSSGSSGSSGNGVTLFGNANNGNIPGAQHYGQGGGNCQGSSAPGLSTPGLSTPGLSIPGQPALTNGGGMTDVAVPAVLLYAARTMETGNINPFSSSGRFKSNNSIKQRGSKRRRNTRYTR